MPNEETEYSVLVVLVRSEEADGIRASVDSAIDITENVPLWLAQESYNAVVEGNEQLHYIPQEEI